MKTKTYDEKAFDELTPEACYWLGFFFADGSIVRTKVGNPMIGIQLGEIDIEHVEKFRSFLKSDHAIIPVKSSKLSAERPDCRPTYQFVIRSKRLEERISELGRKTKREAIACQALRSSRDFWRGVCDGDGSLYFDKTGRPWVSFIGYPGLMGQLAEYLSPVIGFSPNVKPVKNCSLVFTLKTSCIQAIKVADHLYSNPCESLARKLIMANSMMAQSAAWAPRCPAMVEAWKGRRAKLLVKMDATGGN